MWDGYLSSNYHSLQTSVRKSLSNGLMLQGAYTWSKAINMTDDDGWAGVGWNWGPVFGRNRAAAGYDRTHVFQMGWVYELPMGKGKKFATSGVASAHPGRLVCEWRNVRLHGHAFHSHRAGRLSERSQQLADG